MPRAKLIENRVGVLTRLASRLEDFGPGENFLARLGEQLDGLLHGHLLKGYAKESNA
jgi:hypothetical protein